MSTTPSKNESSSILTQPVNQLPIIEELATFMHEQGFANIKELLVYKVSDLLKMEGFGYRCLKSLFEVLQANGCEDLLIQE